MVFQELFSAFIFLGISCTQLAGAESTCGKQLSTIVNFNPKTKKAKMDIFFSSNQEFCDSGLNEINANTKILLLDQNKKILNQKLVFINSFTILETFASKRSSTFSKNKIILSPQYRNLKFSITDDFNRLKFYQIISKVDDSILGEGPIIINKLEDKK